MQSNYMCFREEAIECVKDHVLQIHKQIYAKYEGDHVLQIHKQIYAKYEGDFDRIYTEGYNSKSYTGRVLLAGRKALTRP